MSAPLGWATVLAQPGRYEGGCGTMRPPPMAQAVRERMMEPPEPVADLAVANE